MNASYFDRAPYFLASHVSASYLRAGDKLSPQPFDFDTGITTSNSGLKAPVPDMVKYARFLLGDGPAALYDIVLKRRSLDEAWHGLLPATEPGSAPTPYTSGSPQMGLGFFIANEDGRRLVFHDGDQGGFSSELLIAPDAHIASVLIVNTTDTGAPASSTTLRSESNTEPDPATDLRLTLRQELVTHVFPSLAQRTIP